MDSLKLIDDQYCHQNLAHNTCSLLKPSPPTNGHINTVPELTIIPISITANVNNNVDNKQLQNESVEAKIPSIKPKIVKSSIFKPPCNSSTKLFFYEMMVQLLESQIQNCDMSSWNSINCQIIPTNEPSSSEPNNRLYPRLFDSDHPFVLQPSLFPLVYPTVYFTADDGICKISIK